MGKAEKPKRGSPHATSGKAEKPKRKSPRFTSGTKLKRCVIAELNKAPKPCTIRPGMTRRVAKMLLARGECNNIKVDDLGSRESIKDVHQIDREAIAALTQLTEDDLVSVYDKIGGVVSVAGGKTIQTRHVIAAGYGQ